MNVMKTAMLLVLGLAGVAIAYDPLATNRAGKVVVEDMTVEDGARSREIPLRVYLPGGKNRSPVVLFSHGLGGSNKGCAYLGEHWAARGYVAVFLQHPGSDSAVWKEAARAKRMEAMNAAASGKNFFLRVKDVPAVLDALETWGAQKKHVLEGRVDMGKVGMSGHSFGAVTTQAVSGQNYGRLGARFTDGRIDAAIAFSPSVPNRGSAEDSFGEVEIPWMLMTGTKDVSVIGNKPVAQRIAVYPALPPGGKYLLVLHNAEHSAFSDRALPGDTEKRNPNHHRAIKALSTAFWDACLKDDKAAKKWLDGPQARKVLEERDRWERK
jgi:predicted dienelactone hydrolase